LCGRGPSCRDLKKKKRAPVVDTRNVEGAQYGSSGEEPLDVWKVDAEETWMTPYQRYLADGMLLAERTNAKVVKRNTGRYTLVD